MEKIHNTHQIMTMKTREMITVKASPKWKNAALL